MNFLMGLIPSKIGELSSPIVMDLSYNAFTRDIPSIVGRLPLESLDVSFNNLYVVLPPSLLVVTDAKSNFDLYDMANKCEANEQQTKNKSNGVMVLLVVGTFVATMIILIVGSCYFYRGIKISTSNTRGFYKTTHGT
jgi:hypothetical protein